MKSVRRVRAPLAELTPCGIRVTHLTALGPPPNALRRTYASGVVLAGFNSARYRITATLFSGASSGAGSVVASVDALESGSFASLICPLTGRSIPYSRFCAFCPEGGICDGGPVVLAGDNMWRPDATYANFVECFSCVQTKTFTNLDGIVTETGECTNNTQGWACGVCKPGYIRAPACIPCVSSILPAIAAPLLVAIAVLANVIVPELNGGRSVALVRMLFNHGLSVALASLLVSSDGIPSPAGGMVSFLNVLGAGSHGLVDLPELSCAGPALADNILTQMLVYAVIPAAGGLMAGAGAVACSLCWNKWRSRSLQGAAIDGQQSGLHDWHAPGPTMVLEEHPSAPAEDGPSGKTKPRPIAIPDARYDYESDYEEDGEDEEEEDDEWASSSDSGNNVKKSAKSVAQVKKPPQSKTLQPTQLVKPSQPEPVWSFEERVDPQEGSLVSAQDLMSLGEAHVALADHVGKLRGANLAALIAADAGVEVPHLCPFLLGSSACGRPNVSRCPWGACCISHCRGVRDQFTIGQKGSPSDCSLPELCHVHMSRTQYTALLKHRSTSKAILCSRTQLALTHGSRSWIDASLLGTVAAVYMLQPAAVRACLVLLPCQTFELGIGKTESFLLHDLSLGCDHPLKFLAGLMSFLYWGAVPALYCTFHHILPPRLKGGAARTMLVLRYPVAGVRDGVHAWWGSWDMLFRGALVATFALASDPFSGLAAAICLLCLGMLVHALVRPLEDSLLNGLELASFATGAVSLALYATYFLPASPVGGMQQPYLLPSALLTAVPATFVFIHLMWLFMWARLAVSMLQRSMANRVLRMPPEKSSKYLESKWWCRALALPLPEPGASGGQGGKPADNTRCHMCGKKNAECTSANPHTCDAAGCGISLEDEMYKCLECGLYYCLPKCPERVDEAAVDDPLVDDHEEEAAEEEFDDEDVADQVLPLDGAGPEEDPDRPLTSFGWVDLTVEDQTDSLRGGSSSTSSRRKSTHGLPGRVPSDVGAPCALVALVRAALGVSQSQAEVYRKMLKKNGVSDDAPLGDLVGLLESEVVGYGLPRVRAKALVSFVAEAAGTEVPRTPAAAIPDQQVQQMLQLQQLMPRTRWDSTHSRGSSAGWSSSYMSSSRVSSSAYSQRSLPWQQFIGRSTYRRRNHSQGTEASSEVSYDSRRGRYKPKRHTGQSQPHRKGEEWSDTSSSPGRSGPKYKDLEGDPSSTFPQPGTAGMPKQLRGRPGQSARPPHHAKSASARKQMGGRSHRDPAGPPGSLVCACMAPWYPGLIGAPCAACLPCFRVRMH